MTTYSQNAVRVFGILRDISVSEGAPLEEDRMPKLCGLSADEVHVALKELKAGGAVGHQGAPRVVTGTPTFRDRDGWVALEENI